MNDIIRWYAEDVDRCVSGIEHNEAQAERYDAEAERVAFDAEAQADLHRWVAYHKRMAAEERERLPELRRRLEYVGG